MLDTILLWLVPINNQFLSEVLSVSPDNITRGVIVICVLIFVIFPWFSKLRDIAPALMVSAGIIGTFWGTFIALSEFQTGAEFDDGIVNRKAMVESIPAVLGGMKSAFITSLIGLFSAFLSKVIFNVFPKKMPEPLPVEQNIQDLLKQIKNGIIGEGDKSLSSQLSTIQAEYRDGTKELKQAIAGDSESSIAMQLTKLRNENSEGFKTLDGRLDGLAEAIQVSLVKNMKALMTQIEEVIVKQLSEQLTKTNELLRKQLSEMLNKIEEALIKQFGETFKQFNEATQAIKKWQEKHKAHVEQLTSAFRETAQGIKMIRTDCESIPTTMQQLAQLMGELDARLQAFAEMKTQAEESFPTIKENLDAIGNDLRKSAAGFEGLENTITQAYQGAQKLAQRHIEATQEHIDNMRQVSQQMITDSKKVSTQHADQMKTIISDVQKTSQQCVTNTQESLTKMAEQHAQKVNDLMEKIAERWGQNVVGIAEEAAKIIKSHR